MRISKKYSIYFCWAGSTGVAHEIQIYKLWIRWVRLSGGGWFAPWRPWRRLSILWMKAPDDASHPKVLFEVQKPARWPWVTQTWFDKFCRTVTFRKQVVEPECTYDYKPKSLFEIGK